MPKSKTIKIRLPDFLRLQHYAEKHDLNDIEALGIAVNKLEVKKLESKEKNAWVCDECGGEVPETACFCPYCGVEFEDEDEIEDEDEDEDEEE